MNWENFKYLNYPDKRCLDVSALSEVVGHPFASKWLLEGSNSFTYR